MASTDRHAARVVASESGAPLGWLYDQVTGDEDARVCKDIPPAACRHLPRNFFAYLFSNLLTKISDELASARLVLPWLLSAIGAPATFAGFAVPIRESGVLLPQLMVAAYIRRMPRRKTVWLLGAALSALALALMAATAVTVAGAAAGWAILMALVLYSLARGLCSVSAKDVLGKTVSKMRRGVLMGYSTAAAGIATLGLGLYIEFFGGERGTASLLFVLLVAAAGLWLVAAAIFAAIREEPGATEGGGNALAEAIASLALLRTDVEFRRFVIARALLLSVALVPPFYVVLAQRHVGSELVGLGLLIVASGLAGSLSAPVWGKLGDRSSRLVMVAASAAAGVLGIGTWLLVNLQLPLAHQPFTYALLFLLVSISHSGVQLGRKVYLVDMSRSDTRSAYVAVSNTVIGVTMLAGGLFGVIGDLLDPSYVVLVLGALALVAALYARTLPEISG